MRRAVQRLVRGSWHRPRLIEWGVIAALSVCSLILVFAAATVDLRPDQQLVLAIVTALIFLVCNRRPGRAMTLFLTTLSALVSLRYIVWRATETIEFDTVPQGVLGSGLLLAEAYAVVVLALGYVQTVWSLGRKPLPLPADPADWPTVDVYVPTYNETFRSCAPRCSPPWRSTGHGTSFGSTSSMTADGLRSAISRPSCRRRLHHPSPTIPTPRPATSTTAMTLTDGDSSRCSTATTYRRGRSCN